MKMNNIILIIITLLFNQACGNKDEPCHKTINFINNTEGTLYVTSSYEYPDTMSLRNQPNPILDPNFTKVLPNEKNTKVLWSRDCIESAFKSLIPSDTMMVYIFDAQILETTSWDDVTKNYMVLKRFDLSLLDLTKKDWTITYP